MDETEATKQVSDIMSSSFGFSLFQISKRKRIDIVFRPHTVVSGSCTNLMIVLLTSCNRIDDGCGRRELFRLLVVGGGLNWCEKLWLWAAGCASPRYVPLHQG